jgi:hypothetical protein
VPTAALLFLKLRRYLASLALSAQPDLASLQALAIPLLPPNMPGAGGGFSVGFAQHAGEDGLGVGRVANCDPSTRPRRPCQVFLGPSLVSKVRGPDAGHIRGQGHNNSP